MAREFDYDRDRWKGTITSQDKRAIRYPSAGASVSVGELSRGSFLPCRITESSEIIVTPDHAYDLTLAKACRVNAVRAYVYYLRTVEVREAFFNWFGLEQVYNSVISACTCGIPQARMAEDLSNLRAYWLPRLGKRAERDRQSLEKNHPNTK